VTGGGRRNPVLMQALAERLGTPVAAVEAVGWQGDALEAQAFAYLAVRFAPRPAAQRSGTTGVPRRWPAAGSSPAGLISAPPP